MIEEAAATPGRKAIDDVEQTPGRLVGRLHVETRLDERRRERRCHRPGMERHAEGSRLAAAKLDGRRAHELIERCLGGFEIKQSAVGDREGCRL